MNRKVCVEVVALLKAAATPDQAEDALEQIGLLAAIEGNPTSIGSIQGCEAVIKVMIKFSRDSGWKVLHPSLRGQQILRQGFEAIDLLASGDSENTARFRGTEWSKMVVYVLNSFCSDTELVKCALMSLHQLADSDMNCFDNIDSEKAIVDIMTYHVKCPDIVRYAALAVMSLATSSGRFNIFVAARGFDALLSALAVHVENIDVVKDLLHSLAWKDYIADYINVAVFTSHSGQELLRQAVSAHYGDIQVATDAVQIIYAVAQQRFARVKWWDYFMHFPQGCLNTSLESVMDKVRELTEQNDDKDMADHDEDDKDMDDHDEDDHDEDD